MNVIKNGGRKMCVREGEKGKKKGKENGENKVTVKRTGKRG